MHLIFYIGDIFTFAFQREKVRDTISFLNVRLCLLGSIITAAIYCSPKLLAICPLEATIDKTFRLLTKKKRLFKCCERDAGKGTKTANKDNTKTQNSRRKKSQTVWNRPATANAVSRVLDAIWTWSKWEKKNVMEDTMRKTRAISRLPSFNQLSQTHLILLIQLTGYYWFLHFDFKFFQTLIVFQNQQLLKSIPCSGIYWLLNELLFSTFVFVILHCLLCYFNKFLNCIDIKIKLSWFRMVSTIF